MRTLALINRKGGVGKTTLALHLAAAFQAEGRNVLVLDLDPQASAAEWHDARAPAPDAKVALPHVQSVQPAWLGKVLEQAREIGTDVVVLDTAPHAEATALEAARSADLVLVPTLVSIMDLRAMRKTVELLQLVQVPAFAVLNGVPAQGTIADEATETIVQEFALPVAPVRLGDRVAYSRCLITGNTAQEFEPGGKAALEIAALHAWTCEQMRLSKIAHVPVSAVA
jgi:chromosome partitioning protein